VSGWDPKRYRSQAITAGCDEYLLKPVDFSLLEEILNRYLSPVSVSVARPAGEGGRRPEALNCAGLIPRLI